MSHPPRDLTPLPDLLHDAALAGPARTRRPVHGDLLQPDNAGCPAGGTSRLGWPVPGPASMSGYGGN
jgi:hypothetical protein